MGSASSTLYGDSDHDRTFKEGEACVGLDFGHSSSKMSMAYYLGNSNLPHLHRIPIHADNANAHVLERQSDPHQLLASAGRYKDIWVTGWLSRECDQRIPLKSILTYIAGTSRKRIMEQLPGGKALHSIMEADKSLNSCTMRRLLVEHFQQLHRFAESEAEGKGVKIKVVVVTFPNYLCADEMDDFFEQYRDTLFEIIQPSWGDHIRYEAVSEGQATALYAVEPCDDLYSKGPRKKRLQDLFGGLEASEGLNLLIADNGGSTTNFQSLGIFLDNSGEVLHSQSNVPVGIATGSKGGSNTVNEIVDIEIRKKLWRHIYEQNLAPGQLAAMSRNFDRRKRELDYARGIAPITFTCKTVEGGADTVDVVIGGYVIRAAIEAAFNPGIELIKKEIERVTNLGKDFAVLFCGGSYMNPGLWHATSKMMEGIRKNAKKRNIVVNWAFMRTEPYWSSAVSAGAALSMMHLPAAESLLLNSALGI
ncbi:uncharacterized protein PG986_014143 [Apiospora aurea]|uniref:Actin-like ATPase domain-containing protein n=1 Tax=Apiospora aurea TaxID=335848 RepID=A0ABR1PS51_9PEZI